ncbi:MAG: hypothetical protein ACYS6W_00930 [Planctomycetota bacterium]|jgi:hypothetical protein
MEAKREFTTSDVRLTIDLCLSLLGVLGFGALSLYLLFGVTKAVFLAFGSSIWLEAVAHIGIAIVGVICISLFIFATVLFVKMTWVYYHLFSLTVAVLADAIEITTKASKCLIQESDIMYIFGYKTGITLVWKFGESPMTFFITKNLFGTKAFKELSLLLGRFAAYTNDEYQIEKIRRSLKLNHIFRKNRYEFQLSKQRSEQKNFVC